MASLCVRSSPPTSTHPRLAVVPSADSADHEEQAHREHETENYAETGRRVALLTRTRPIGKEPLPGCLFCSPALLRSAPGPHQRPDREADRTGHKQAPADRRDRVHDTEAAGAAAPGAAEEPAAAGSCECSAARKRA